jgi:hypothetical protein
MRKVKSDSCLGLEGAHFGWVNIDLGETKFLFTSLSTEP